MKIKKKSASWIFGLALSCLSMSASAAVLYGTTGAGPSNNSNLITIDTATGATTVIGSVGFNVNGLTFDISSGTLYGSVGNDGGLLSINTSTGAGTLIGSGFNSPAIGCDSRNVLLTSNSSGSLFGWCDPASDDLMTIDKVTGLAMGIVGESGISTGVHGLAFDNNDALFLHNFDGSVYSIDTLTGAASLITNVGAVAHHGDFNPDDNFYYGMAAFGPGGTIGVYDHGATNSLQSSIQLDRGDVFTLAFAGPAAPVPEPATLALLGLGLAGIGYQRRQRSMT